MNEYDAIRHLSPRNRPTMLPPDYRRAFFQGMHLRTFCVLMGVYYLNGVLAMIVRESWVPLLPTVIGSVFLLVTWIAICSGVSSSNQGTWFRKSEPVRYWTDCAITTAFTLLAAAGGWVIAVG